MHQWSISRLIRKCLWYQISCCFQYKSQTIQVLLDVIWECEKFSFSFYKYVCLTTQTGIIFFRTLYTHASPGKPESFYFYRICVSKSQNTLHDKIQDVLISIAYFWIINWIRKSKICVIELYRIYRAQVENCPANTLNSLCYATRVL